MYAERKPKNGTFVDTGVCRAVLTIDYECPLSSTYASNTWCMHRAVDQNL